MGLQSSVGSKLYPSQSVHAVPSDVLPAAQNLQDADAASFWFWYLPLAQAVHAVDLDVNSLPLSQNLHWYSVAAAIWYLPVSQSPHAAVALAAYCPAAQVRQVTEGASFSFWYFPPEQSTQSVDLVLNLLPATQNLHSTDASLFWVWYFPASQSGQAVALVSNFLPATQNLQLYSSDCATS